MSKFYSFSKRLFFWFSMCGILNGIHPASAHPYTAPFAMNIPSSVFSFRLHELSNGSHEARPGLVIKGQVTDSVGNPLVGVSVSLKGTSIGTATDADGKYSLDLPDGTGVLVFSYVGYIKKEVPVAGHDMVNVVLKPGISTLNQLVVVGYGTQKKANLTGAVSQVSAKVLEDRPVSNVGQALQGVAPGLNVDFNDGRPGGQAQINIRGYTSINGGKPLILIDGVPGDISLVNPMDIASISILKDASSAAIYGARAAYGVILITTKNGHKGKLQTTYRANFSIGSPTTSYDFMTNGYKVAKLIDAAYKISKGSSFTGYTDEDYEELKKRQTDHSLPSVVIQNRNGKDQYVWYANTDWWNYFFKSNQPSMSHSIQFSGGNEKVDFLVSGRYYRQSGMMKLNTDKYTSYNFRAKINAQMSSWLTVSDNLQFAANTYNYPGYSYNDAFHHLAVSTLPSYVPVNPDGTFTYLSGLNKQEIANGYSAILLYGKAKGQQKQFDFRNTLNFDITLSQYLAITANYSFDLNPSSSFNRRTRVPWSIYPGVIDYLGEDYYTEQSDLDQHHVVNAYATYKRSFGNHYFKIMAGYNQELQKYHRIDGRANNLLSEDLNALDLGTDGQQTGSNSVEWALLGFFGRINYNYKEKYLVELDGRYDGSSHFPQGSRFGLFPSVSAGWRISEEPFFSVVKHTISELKFRTSYGSLGNQSLSTNLRSANYPYIPVMNTGLLSWLAGGSQMQYLQVGSPVPPDLTWEHTTSINFGIDMGLFENKLTVNFDWYDRKTIGMLIPGKTLPSVFGAPSPTQNAGDLDTKGWEFSAKWNNTTELGGKPFVYNVGLVLSDFKSHITRFDNPAKALNNYYPGERLGEIWGYTVDGYFASDKEAQSYPVNQDYVNRGRLASPGQGSKLQAGDLKFVDLNGDQVINVGKNTLSDHGDLKVIGNSLPRYSFGITAGASWRGFDISVFLQGIGHQDWYPGRFANLFWGPYSFPYGTFIPKDFDKKIWSEDNPDAYFPKLRGYAANGINWELQPNNTRYLQDLAYVRLKNMTVGYNLPSAVINRIDISAARIYFSGENVFTLSKLKTRYIDPEQVSSNPNGTGGNAYAWNYPFMKQFSFGLDITF